MFFKLETGDLEPRMIQYTPLGGPLRTLVGSNTSGTQIFGLRRRIAVGNDVSHAFLRNKVPGLQIPGPREAPGRALKDLGGVQHLYDPNIWAYVYCSGK